MENTFLLHQRKMINKQNSLIHFDFVCEEDFSKMPKTERGKFCSSCDKDVVDFSLFSSQEALNFLNTHKYVCGSLSASQLEQLNAYAGLQQVRSFSLKAMLTSMVLGISSLSMSQEKNKVLFENESIKVMELANGINPDSVINNKIIGIITDEHGEPLPFVQVILPDANQRIRTDIEGKFNVLYDDTIPGSIRLQSISPYCNDSNLVAQDYANKNVQIILKENAEEEITVGLIIAKPPSLMERFDTRVRAIFRYNED